MKTMLVRGILTLALIYGVYTETGLWTATCLLLTALAIEALIYQERENDEQNNY